MTSGGNVVEHQTENHNNQNIVNNPLGNSLTKKMSISLTLYSLRKKLNTPSIFLGNQMF